VLEAAQAAEALAREGVGVEVVDLRTLVPLDQQGILDSFRKTHRAIVLHEAVARGGFGGEVVSLIMEKAFDDLAAPVMRIGSKPMPIPMNPILEKFYLPSVEDVVATAKKLMSY
jgi:pyruvate dehydrogenase E1 component beta subunit